MSLKSIKILYIFIILSTCSVWGQVVVRDSVEVKSNEDKGGMKNLLFKSNNDELSDTVLTILSEKSSDSLISYSGISNTTVIDEIIRCSGTPSTIKCYYVYSFTIPIVSFNIPDNMKYYVYEEGAHQRNLPLTLENLNAWYGNNELGIQYVTGNNRIDVCLLDYYLLQPPTEICNCNDYYPYAWGSVMVHDTEINEEQPVVQKLEEDINTIFFEVNWSNTYSEFVKCNKIYILIYGYGLHHFQVVAAKDSINYSETTYFNIQGRDFEDNNFEPSNSTLLTCKLDTSSQKYGTLLGPNQTTGSVLEDVTYADAKAGGVKFIANGEKPDSLVKVMVHFVLNEDASVKGDGEVMVRGEKVKLKITEPVVEEDEDKIFDITDTPEMPTITCKAKLSGYDEESIPEAQWECRVSYDYPPGSDEETYTEEDVAFDENFISEWDLDFNDSATIIGGKVTIKVSAEINEKSYLDSLVVFIRGENPDNDDVVNELDAGEIALLETEVPNYSQFDTEQYAVPNEGLPLQSDTSRNDQGELVGDLNGWGISQLDDRWHDITTAILWDWTENLNAGMEYYNDMRDGARNHLGNIGNLDTPAEDQTRQSMIDIEGYARYNDGPDGQFWEWVEVDRTNPVGYWRIHATHRIRLRDEETGELILDENGETQWVRRDADALNRNVNRYLRYYNN